MWRQRCGLIIVILTLPVHALIDFYGYQENRSKNDSLVTYKQTLLGHSELEISQITVKPCGTYLDVTEDAWISSDVSKLNIENMTGDYLFKGTVPIQHEATVTGLQTWRGKEMFRAKLKKSEYVSDGVFPDSVTLQQSLDSRIALLQKHTENSFEITLTRVSLGEQIHIRIRYMLCPVNTENGLFKIPVLFHTRYGETPEHIRLVMFANNSDQLFKYKGPHGTLLLNDTSTTLVKYEDAILLQHGDTSLSSINITGFTSGAYNGHYAVFNTGVTDTVVAQLSKPISTVFIWRWNGPPPMTANIGGIRTLSPYAWDVISQAEKIRKTIQQLERLGNHCALIHSVEGSSEYVFQSDELDKSETSRIIEYLHSMNEQELYETYRNEDVEVPKWSVTENGNKTEIQKGRDDFKHALSSAESLLKKDSQGDFKHIIIMSIGGIADRYLKDISETLAIDDSQVTIDYTNVVWRGVDVVNTLPVYPLNPWYDHLFPSFSPSLIQLTIHNSEKPFSFPFEKNTWFTGKTFTARTSATWDTTFLWTGYDAEGNVTRTIEEYPQVFSFHADSGLAKLWAGDKGHIADKEEIYPGGTFGILTKATFLQATTNDMNDDVSVSVPFLSDEEILAPRSVSVKKNNTQRVLTNKIRIMRGNLYIPCGSAFTTLKVFNIQGRLILSLNLESYLRAGGAFTIPLSKLLKQHNLNIMVVKLSGKGQCEVFHIINGRIK